jgi:uncharacterized protein YndB with AHSA1/START domain
MSAGTIHADGTITKDEQGRDVIRFERRLAHPIEEAWAAITEPDRLIKWWGEADVDLTQGGAFNLRWLNTDEDGNAVALDAHVVELEPPRVLELAGEWYAESAKGRTDVTQASLRFELSSEGRETLLRFENTVERGEPGVVAGWHYHLDVLALSLDGGSVDLTDPWDAVAPINEAYGVAPPTRP